MIDIGLNLTSSQFAGEQPELVARARAAGVEALILTGTDLAESAAAAELAARVLAHVGEQRRQIESQAQAIEFRDAKIASITFELRRLKARGHNLIDAHFAYPDGHAARIAHHLAVPDEVGFGDAGKRSTAPGSQRQGRVQPVLADIPREVDRSQGDVHAAGNPHIQTDPRNIERVARALTQRLAEVDPAHGDTYRARSADFLARWGQATARWTQAAAPLRGTPIVVQHEGFPYLEAWLGLRKVATLEPKPGVEASSAHLAGVLRQLQAHPARMVLRAAYNDGRSSAWLAQRTGLPEVVLPYTVGGNEQAGTLFGLFDDTVARLLKAASPLERP